jgi:glutamate racemase
MIWIFDSGLWWLQSLTYFKKLLPKYDYIFLADNKNAPYWEKTPEEINEMTFTWLHRLFDQWAKIVILACNTASAYAIKQRQTQFPHKKVLSVSIPWIEAMIEWNYRSIGILATDATAQSWIFERKFNELVQRPWTQINIIPASKLVPLIENWQIDSPLIDEIIKEYISFLPSNIDVLVLWCTHFPILQKKISDSIQVPMIDPAREAANKFIEYLKRHPEIETQISRWSTTKFYCTWENTIFNEVWSEIIWSPIKAEKVKIW